jgi:hypothetical protein
MTALVESQELTELHFNQVDELLIVDRVNLVEEHDQAGDADLRFSDVCQAQLHGRVSRRSQKRMRKITNRETETTRPSFQ